MSIALNLLVMGKTGTGKSSFINYLASGEKVKVGAGKRITEEVIKKVDINNFKVAMYDTRAIEVGSCWENSIFASFDAVKKKADFDIILYCFSSLENDLENKEIEKIVEIRRNKKIIFIVTSDDIKKSAENGVLRKLKGMGYTENDFVMVNSEEKLFLTGEKSLSYGKNEVFKAIRNKVEEEIAMDINSDFNIVISRRIPMWSLRCKNELKSNKSFFKMKDERKDDDDLVDDFNRYLKETEEALNEELKDILKKTYQKYDMLYDKSILKKCDDILITSKLYIPDNNKKGCSPSIIDKIEKHLERYWRDNLKIVINNFGS
ncbi:MAG: GTPase domain-containing protein [Sarcina sp.]